MEEPVRAPKPSALSSLATFVQSLIFLFFALLSFALLLDFEKVDTPGAPVQLLYASLAALVVLAIIHFPKVFKHLPRTGRIIAYVAIIPGFFLFGTYTNQMQAVWGRTPQGAQEAAERAKKEEAQAKIDATREAEEANRRDTERNLAELKSATDQLQALREKMEGCFSTFGHRLSALEDPVKESLHNPGAFEHVETFLIVPTDENKNSNVQMTFRAENQFGALRSARVLAQLVPDDCSVRNISEIETE